MIYLDTHVLVWLYAGRPDLLPAGARALIDANALLVSPIVALELQYLHETGRTNEPAAPAWFQGIVATVAHIVSFARMLRRVLLSTIQSSWELCGTVENSSAGFPRACGNRVAISICPAVSIAVPRRA